MKKDKTGIILLSGGLDSAVALAAAISSCNINLALTFDYGQKPLEAEIEASRKICAHYNLNHKIIRLDFLETLCKPDSVWVPNRNGLFLNIAACFADSIGCDYIIFGANHQEASEFIDNSENFVKAADNLFEFSTNVKVKVFAPLLHLNKSEIVTLALQNGVPLEFIYSCYENYSTGSKKHCGRCTSCKQLMEALKNSSKRELIKILF